MMAGNHVAPETSNRTRNYLMASVFRDRRRAWARWSLKAVIGPNRCQSGCSTDPLARAQRWRDL